MKLLCLALALSIPITGMAMADNWKDESGKAEETFKKRAAKTREKDLYGHSGEYGIPAGHLPPAGECKQWLDDRPAGQQPPPVACPFTLPPRYDQ